MKHLLFMTLVMLAGLASATWTNDALPDILEARYDFQECNVDYAEEWLSMREGCGDEHNVSVFDSSEYVENLQDDLADLKEATDEVDRLEFGLAMVKLGADSLELIGQIVRDAFDHKTLAFFSCVRDGEDPLQDDLADCRALALEKEKDAARGYVQNEIDYANEQVDEMQEEGADTSGMEEIVDHAEDLVDDVDAAYESGDMKEVRKLHLRHSRLILLFRLEKMLSVINYAEPIIEDSNNDNKEEILERGNELRDDVEALLVECEYSDDVDDNLDYGTDNVSCWADAVDLYAEFNALGLLIIEGAL